MPDIKELEQVECFKCHAPRWIHGRSDWYCMGFIDPNSTEAVYDKWGVLIKPGLANLSDGY